MFEIDENVRRLNEKEKKQYEADGDLLVLPFF